MANARLYSLWVSLTEALQTGQPQNEAKQGSNPFDALHADPVRLRQFLSAMTGISVPAAQAIANQFPWRDYHSFVDVGCAQRGLPIQLGLRHPHLRGVGFDLPGVAPVFQDYITEFRLGDRLRLEAGAFSPIRCPVLR
jgi:O-methyltransferase domain